MEVTGIIKRIGATQVVSDKFQKREVHIQTAEQFPQVLSIEFAQDKCSILDNYAAGQEVTIGINLRGREWTSPQGEVKAFNTIQGWKISATGSAPVAATTTVQSNDDGLPF
jgi:hypothetical protein